MDYKWLTDFSVVRWHYEQRLGREGDICSRELGCARTLDFMEHKFCDLMDDLPAVASLASFMHHNFLEHRSLSPVFQMATKYSLTGTFRGGKQAERQASGAEIHQNGPSAVVGLVEPAILVRYTILSRGLRNTENDIASFAKKPVGGAKTVADVRFDDLPGATPHPINLKSPMPFPASPATRLHEMNRLEDMGRFPVVVYMGATANVLGSILLFYWLHGRYGGNLVVGVACAVVLLVCNLLPVALLRWREGTAGLADTPPVERMGFVRDQHRFATWVYAVASGNLFFWLMLAWAAFDLEHSARALLGVEALAFVCTFAPVWLRLLRRDG